MLFHRAQSRVSLVHTVLAKLACKNSSLSSLLDETSLAARNEVRRLFSSANARLKKHLIINSTLEDINRQWEWYGMQCVLVEFVPGVIENKDKACTVEKLVDRKWAAAAIDLHCFTQIEHRAGAVGREVLVHKIPVLTSKYNDFLITLKNSFVKVRYLFYKPMDEN